MKHSRRPLAVLCLTLSFLLGFQTMALASPVAVGRIPLSMTFDEQRMKVEAPYEFIVGFGEMDILSLPEDKLPSSDNYYLTRAVDIRYSSKNQIVNSLVKPMRLSFYFDEIDWKRASNLNTSLPLGRFRVGVWDAAKNSWIILPSQIYWNGNQGVVEAATNKGSGIYGLLWSYSGDSLTPMGEDNIRLMINYSVIEPPAPPYVKYSRTMVPLRVIAENLGVDVKWNYVDQRIDLISQTQIIQLWVGSSEVQIDSLDLDKNDITSHSTSTLEASPEIVNGYTYVPLRFVGEALGAEISWDQLTRTAVLVKKQN